MPQPGLPPFAAFKSLVEAVDPDAAHRIPVLEEAAPVLYGGAALPPREAAKLADRLERWRYQLLNKRDGHLPPDARALADALDLAGGTVRGQPRAPKRPRTVLEKTLADDAVGLCLDPAASLAEVSARARDLTERHFPGSNGYSHRMLLYAPLYLSSFCVNHCLYCWFRFPQPLQREHLHIDPALAEAAILRQRGFRHLLLVAGDFPRLTSTSYLTEIVQALTAQGFSVAVEIAPQSTLSYSELARAGAWGVTLYQETYQEEMYARYHPLGPKVWFDWRLEGPERAAEAGMSRLGLGILLGLADPAANLRALMRHGHYLQERFPHVQLAFSLPRIHEAPAGFVAPYQVDDETLIRLYCALRLAFPTAELVLSTRERPALRDRLARICITLMSAGSSTSPGGYSAPETDTRARQQFPVSDDRSPAELAEVLRRAGLDIRWQ